MKVRAFTTKFRGIQNKLINDAIIMFQGEEMHTKTAQWDTGATCTCISRSVASRLNLIPIGKTIIRTPSGEVIVNKYLIDIKLRNNLIVKDVQVIETEIGAQGIDLLIGMDIINLGDFAISNFNGKTHFCFRFPSQGDADFVKDSE